MEVIQLRDVPDKAAALQHRGNGIGFRPLFHGNDGDAPNNYSLMFATQKDFYSPAHKHNFDQFRFPVKGTINIRPDLDIHAGELCYHPEGVVYGPQNDGPEEKEVLVLQFGGASGQGYLGHTKLKEAQQTLIQNGGVFQNGHFLQTPQSEAIDGYQASWEAAMGRKMSFPQGRYGAVISMRPSAYSEVRVGSEDGNSVGISKKTLGVFSEREVRAEIFKVWRGKEWAIPVENATRIYWVMKGEGLVEDEPLKAESVGRLQAGRKARVRCTGLDLEILCFVIPIIPTLHS